MKYYTETISVSLAEKLKEKGMPIEVVQKYAQSSINARGIVPAGVGLKCPSFAEVFDWLREKGYIITIMHRWSYANGRVMDWMPVINACSFDYMPTWHEAAEKAIEKALTLI